MLERWNIITESNLEIRLNSVPWKSIKKKTCKNIWDLVAHKGEHLVHLCILDCSDLTSFLLTSTSFHNPYQEHKFMMNWAGFGFTNHRVVSIPIPWSSHDSPRGSWRFMVGSGGVRGITEIACMYFSLTVSACKSHLKWAFPLNGFHEQVLCGSEVQVANSPGNGELAAWTAFLLPACLPTLDKFWQKGNSQTKTKPAIFIQQRNRT